LIAGDEMVNQLVAEEPISDQHGFVIGGVQIKAARTLLGWTIADLAHHARIGTATVQRAEASLVPSITVPTMFAIQRTLENAGIIFIDPGQVHIPDGGIGVRLKRST
jgi:transcriptional regulator with XRE-family HTH domain